MQATPSLRLRRASAPPLGFCAGKTATVRIVSCVGTGAHSARMFLDRRALGLRPAKRRSALRFGPNHKGPTNALAAPTNQSAPSSIRRNNSEGESIYSEATDDTWRPARYCIGKVPVRNNTQHEEELP